MAKARPSLLGVLRLRIPLDADKDSGRIPITNPPRSRWEAIDSRNDYQHRLGIEKPLMRPWPILDRLAHDAHRFELEGESLRKEARRKVGKGSDTGRSAEWIHRDEQGKGAQTPPPAQKAVC